MRLGVAGRIWDRSPTPLVFPVCDGNRCRRRGANAALETLASQSERALDGAWDGSFLEASFPAKPPSNDPHPRRKARIYGENLSRARS
jgi:hypothetical protein